MHLVSGTTTNRPTFLTNRCVWYIQIAEKNEQIEKLIKRVTVLHTLNNEFAAEHEKLQKDVVTLREKSERFEQMQQSGCESCRSYATTEARQRAELTELTAGNKQLSDDIRMLKILIYRLNVQLERYQEMVRKKKSRDVGDVPVRDDSCAIVTSAAGTEEPINWGDIHTNTLGPLLNAYQETINDKTELIWQQELELNRMAGRLKDILVENGQLHVEMDATRRTYDARTEEQTMLQAQLDVCRQVAFGFIEISP